jgi:hypothetical protein
MHAARREVRSQQYLKLGTSECVVVLVVHYIMSSLQSEYSGSRLISENNDNYLQTQFAIFLFHTALFHSQFHRTLRAVK